MNVTTLMPDANAKGQRPNAAKLQLTQRQRAHIGAEIIALQETRFSRETMLSMASYLVLAAPAEKGRGA
eukprot:6569634-Alexandrium_andersonii.AAC.1